MAENSYKTTWDFSNKHIDSSIQKDNFISASRTIVYSAPYTSAGVGASAFHRIGVCQGYSWGEQRPVELIYELGSDLPYLVPGRTVGNISLSRILVYGMDLINVLYYETTPKNNDNIIKSLKEIESPIDMMFAMYDSKTNKPVYSRVFSGAWIESRSESISAGQILVAENISIRYEDVVGIKLTA